MKLNVSKALRFRTTIHIYNVLLEQALTGMWQDGSSGANHEAESVELHGRNACVRGCALVLAVLQVRVPAEVAARKQESIRARVHVLVHVVHPVCRHMWITGPQDHVSIAGRGSVLRYKHSCYLVTCWAVVTAHVSACGRREAHSDWRQIHR